METHLSLFDAPTATADPPPRKFANAHTTRAAAGIAIKPTAAKLRARVLRYIQEQGSTGATDQETQIALGMDGSTQRPRRVELLRAGLIRDSGQTRLTSAGRCAAVWIALNASAIVDQGGEPQEEPPF